MPNDRTMKTKMAVDVDLETADNKDKNINDSTCKKVHLSQLETSPRNEKGRITESLSMENLPEYLIVHHKNALSAANSVDKASTILSGLLKSAKSIDNTSLDIIIKLEPEQRNETMESTEIEGDLETNDGDYIEVNVAKLSLDSKKVENNYNNSSVSKNGNDIGDEENVTNDSEKLVEENYLTDKVQTEVLETSEKFVKDSGDFDNTNIAKGDESKMNSIYGDKNLTMSNEEFIDLLSAGKSSPTNYAHASYHDLDLIDTSDLIKTSNLNTDSNDLLSSSAGSLMLKEEVDLINVTQGSSSRLSSDEIISKVADCILEMDGNDASYDIREYIPIETSSASQAFNSTYRSPISSSLSGNNNTNIIMTMNAMNEHNFPSAASNISNTESQIQTSLSNIIKNLDLQLPIGDRKDLQNHPNNTDFSSMENNHSQLLIDNSSNSPVSSLCYSHSATILNKAQNQKPLDVALQQQQQHYQQQQQQESLSRQLSQNGMTNLYPANQNGYQNDSVYDETTTSSFIDLVSHDIGNEVSAPSDPTNQSYQPLFVNTATTRIPSVSDEKLYSPKHILAGAKLYSPRMTSSTSNESKQHRKVDIEPCDIVRSIINYDVPVIPDPPPLPPIEKIDDEKIVNSNPVPITSSKQTSPVKNRYSNANGLSKFDKLSTGFCSWRQVLKQKCSSVPKKNITEKSLADILKPLNFSNKFSDLVKKANGDEEILALLMQHASQKEKLKINMINELTRITSNCKLMSIEKGPISASIVLYFQHDDAARKLESTLDFMNKSTHMPDIQKLYDAKIMDLQDKHEKLLSVLKSRQSMELDSLQKRKSLDTIFNDKEILRRRYFRVKHRYKIFTQ